MMMCLGVNSQAQNGVCGLTISVIFSASPLLNERNLIYFFQCRGACKYFGQRGFPEGSHAFVVRRPLDFGSGSSFDDHFTNVIGKIEQLVNCGTAPKTCAVAFQTALTLIEIKLTVFRRL